MLGELSSVKKKSKREINYNLWPVPDDDGGENLRSELQLANFDLESADRRTEVEEEEAGAENSSCEMK